MLRIVDGLSKEKREESYSDEIVSDLGNQVRSHFYKQLCQRMDVRPKFSTAHRPQTDRETEVVNARIRHTLRASINYKQDDLAMYHYITKFEGTSSILSSTWFIN